MVWRGPVEKLQVRESASPSGWQLVQASRAEGALQRPSPVVKCSRPASSFAFVAGNGTSGAKPTRCDEAPALPRNAMLCDVRSTTPTIVVDSRVTDVGTPTKGCCEPTGESTREVQPGGGAVGW